MQKREEDPCFGWKLRIKVKWFTLHQKKMKKKEGLNKIESEEEVHIYEPDQGVILGKENEDVEVVKPMFFRLISVCKL